MDYIQEYSSLLFSGLPQGIAALKYLKENRCLTEDTIKLFEIGYCGSNSEVPGNTDDEKRLNRNLQDKIVIPIKSEFGDLLAFASRSYSSDTKGWWHQVFEKNNNFFLFDVAKEEMLNSGKVYLVEGYFDALALYQVGIKNVCALMGTSLGHRRIGLLARYCDNVCLCYDSDEKNQAGLIAQAKSVSEFYQYGWNNISSIILPIGMDPDEYVFKFGKEDFLRKEKILSQKNIIQITQRYQQFIKK